jgi:hypothetical protein
VNNKYKYHNIPLEPKIVSELVFELFVDKGNVKVSDIIERVTQLHVDRGGLRHISSRPRSVFNKSLKYLKKEGKITMPSIGYWNIHHPEFDKNDEHVVQTIGEGKGVVYLYYYPSHKERAKSKKSPVWECKIGKTDGDPYERVREQTDKKTGLPEEPQIALIIKTDDPLAIEQAIHSVLKARGRLKDAPGKEWFTTSPNEVEHIYNKILDK